MNIKEVTSLLVALKKDIGDEYRCSNDPDDDTPGMQVTVATTDGKVWSYQTGDNSYTGGCYHYQHWSVIYLFRDSNCRDLARGAVEECMEPVWDERRERKERKEFLRLFRKRCAPFTLWIWPLSRPTARHIFPGNFRTIANA